MKFTRHFSWLVLLGCCVASVTFAAESKQEADKKIVRAFYEEALNTKDFASASQYLTGQFSQEVNLCAQNTSLVSFSLHSSQPTL